VLSDIINPHCILYQDCCHIVWFSLITFSSKTFCFGLQLECSFVEEKSQVQHSVTLELEKKQRCGKVAYDILGNLLEHNSKQNVSQAHSLNVSD